MTKDCHNCHYQLEGTEKFCPECGQEVKPLHLSLWALINDVIGDTFNLDSRLFRTIYKLFIPGALTLAYFEGKRKRYFSPFRVLLISVIIALAYINFFYADSIHMNTPLNDETSHFAVAVDSLDDRFDLEKEDIFAAFPELDTTEVYRLKDSILHPDEVKDFSIGSLNIFGLEFQIGDSLGTDSTGRVYIPMRDLLYTPLSELGKSYEESDWLPTTVARQVVKMFRNPSAYTASILSNLVWMIIFMLPMIALILMLLYMRKDYYFVQHMTFLYHISAFHVVTIVLAMILSIPFSNYVYLGALVLTQLYHFLAFSRVYKDRGFRKVLKFITYSIWSTLVISIALLIYFLITFAIF